MQYDTQWTPQERARVEALRLLMSRATFDPADSAKLGEEIVRAGAPIAEFLAGPEAKHPYPWDKSAEAVAKLRALIQAAGVRDQWVARDTEITVKAADLWDVVNLLPGQEPPF